MKIIKTYEEWSPKFTKTIQGASSINELKLYTKSSQGQGVEESKIYESDYRLHRIISKYYKNFLTNFFDDNDPDRDGINIDQQRLSDDFINDCIELFGENGSDEYNSGYSDREVKNIANQVIDEDK